MYATVGRPILGALYTTKSVYQHLRLPHSNRILTLLAIAVFHSNAMIGAAVAANRANH